MTSKPAFTLKCTPNPDNPGFCRETWGDIGVDTVHRISDELDCNARLREWARIEAEARGNGGLAD